MTTTVLGIELENRVETANEFQKIITSYGCDIRTRLGLHSSENGACSNKGIVLLEVIGDGEKLISELEKRWNVQKMVF